MELTQPLTNAAKRSLVLAALADEANIGLSDHKLAEKLGVSHRYVGILRKAGVETDGNDGNVSTLAPEELPPADFMPMATVLVSAGLAPTTARHWVGIYARADDEAKRAIVKGLELLVGQVYEI
jgi:hypothetical protein